MNKLPDVHNDTKPEIGEHIDRIGVQKVKIPIMFIGNHNSFKTIATVSMLVSLNYDIRAVSLSKFMIYLKEYIDKPMIIPDDVFKLLKSFDNISKHTVFKTSTIRFDFDYSINKKSPVSGNVFPQFYRCFFKFELMCGDNLISHKGVTVPYSSYCPCSHSLCEYTGEGIPHAQRSYCDLIIESEEKCLTLGYMIKLIEECVVNETYPIIKRDDEQDIAITASKNTFFIEDIIRLIERNLRMIDSAKDWIVRLRHEESIHSHEVMAIAWKGEEFGFNETTFYG